MCPQLQEIKEKGGRAKGDFWLWSVNFFSVRPSLHIITQTTHTHTHTHKYTVSNVLFPPQVAQVYTCTENTSNI